MSVNKRNELRECFELLDSNNNGTLEFDELITALNVLEVKHSPEQLARMLSREVARSKTAQLRDRRGGLQSATGHHHAISKKNSNSPSVSYADFVNIMTDVLPGHAEVESTIEGGHHVGLPLRLMLSAFRRKKTLEVFMNNSSARARLAAKGQEQANRELYGAGSAEDGNGSATLGAEKRSSSSEHLAGLGGKGAGGMQTRAMNRTSRKLSHLHGMSMSDGGRQTSSAMYLGPGMRSGMHSSAAARRGAKSSSSSSLLASTSFTDGLGPSYLHIDNSSGSLPSATAGESRSLHTSGACVSERMPGVKASVSTPNLLPVVRAHTSYADRNSCLREASEATFIRAPRTANRTTRILKGRHDQMSSVSVSHLAWQQQQVLLSQVDRWSERQRGATQASCSHFHKGNSVDGAKAAPPPIRLRDERPSTSYVIQEASRKLEEAHSSSFLSRSHQRPRGSDTVQAAGQHHQRGVVPATRYGATDRAGGGRKTGSGRLPSCGGGVAPAARARPWSRYKSWRCEMDTSKHPWISAGSEWKHNSDASGRLDRIKAMRENANGTSNIAAIRLLAMRLVRE